MCMPWIDVYLYDVDIAGQLSTGRCALTFRRSQQRELLSVQIVQTRVHGGATPGGGSLPKQSFFC